MPSKNKIKIYLPNSVYHVYNRGVEKRKIFNETRDYVHFIEQLKGYLLPKDQAIKELTSRCRSLDSLIKKTIRISHMPSYCGKISILAFALMPNHFHLLIKQTGKADMTGFMRSLGTSYSMFFNYKYKRVGSLFQDIYKARLILDDDDLLDTIGYIDRNPYKLTRSIENYPYSSLKYYVSGKPPIWISTNAALDSFRRSPYYNRYSSYLDFIKDQP